MLKIKNYPIVFIGAAKLEGKPQNNFRDDSVNTEDKEEQTIQKALCLLSTGICDRLSQELADNVSVQGTGKKFRSCI